MARIRTLKPDWLENERLAACSDAARLLSASLILLADDYGNGRAAEGFLLGRVWLYSDEVGGAREKLRRALDELQRIEFVVLYRVSRQRFYHLPGWPRHQLVQHPGKPHVPGPQDGETIPVECDRQLQIPEGLQKPSLLTSDLRSPDLRTSDQDHQTTIPASGGSPSAPGGGVSKSTGVRAPELTAAVVEAFNAGFDRHLSADRYVHLTEKLLAQGYDPEAIYQVVRYAIGRYGDDRARAKRYTPTTFLRLESRDGAKAFPEWLALTEESIREETGGEPAWRRKNGARHA